jgi:hypothetical protein
MSLDIGRKFSDRSVSPFPRFFQSLHRDPVEIAIHQAAQGRRVSLAVRRDAGRRRTHGAQLARERRSFFFTNDAEHPR